MSTAWACDVLCCVVCRRSYVGQTLWYIAMRSCHVESWIPTHPFTNAMALSPFEAVNCRSEMKKIPKNPKVGQGSRPSSRVVAPYLRFASPGLSAMILWRR